MKKIWPQFYCVRCRFCLETQFHILLIESSLNMCMMHCSQERRLSILLDPRLMEKALLFMVVMEGADQSLSLTLVIMFVNIGRKWGMLRRIATSFIVKKSSL